MLTYSPFDSRTPEMNSVDALRGNPLEGTIGPVNLGESERLGSIVGGAALLLTGLSRRTVPGLLLAAVGGAFIFRGVAGHCKLYDSLGVSTARPQRAGVAGGSGRKIEKSIVINRPPSELFRFWRNLENLPEFMENLQSVRALDDRLSHWVVKGPAGHFVEWDAEIVNEHPGEMISWQTLPGADVQSAGTVRFTPLDGGHSTNLRVVLEFRPPGGAVGAHVARLFGRDPDIQLDRDLHRLKSIIESHDLPATA